MIKLIISCLNVNFKKLIVWLQLYPKLIASDYITTGRPLGRTKAVHSCLTPQGAWSRGSEAWLADPSGLTYFNRNGRVRGLGKASWCVSKAFDKVPHRRLIDKIKHYGVNNQVTSWIQCFLSGRRQRIVVEKNPPSLRCCQVYP